MQESLLSGIKSFAIFVTINTLYECSVSRDLKCLYLLNINIYL